MMHLPIRPTAALISRRALQNNLRLVQKQVRQVCRLHYPGAKIMAVVKADCYGHKISVIMPELERLGIRQFAVATLDEAIEARKISKQAEILVLGGTFEWNRQGLDLLHKNRLQVAASSVTGLQTLLKAGAKLHLKLDTGMNRLGIKPEDWGLALQMIKKSGRPLEGLFTHFATSSDLAFDRQTMLFEEATRWFVSSGIRPHNIHCENSGAIFTNRSNKRTVLSELGNLVRPGISLYGYTPRGIKPIKGLMPVLELVSQVGIVKPVEKGEGISYGHLYRAPKKHSYAVVPVGYADGLSKQYSGSLVPELQSSSGKKKGSVKICGAICMDMIMVRSIGGEKFKPGDRVALWGRFPNQVLKDGLVEAYELNLRISKRIPRILVP